jgi:exonuclease III
MASSNSSCIECHIGCVGSQLKRLDYRVDEWDVDFTAYLEKLRKNKPVVVAGDFNCARDPIDIHNARGNLKSAGFTPQERESFQKVRFIV